MKNKRELQRAKRHHRIVSKVRGTAQRPRLVIHRSLNNLTATVVDDTSRKVVFALSTINKQVREKIAKGGNVKAAEAFAAVFAGKAKESGIKKLVFDRAGYLYHGRVKAFADGLRKQGMEF